MNTNLRGSSRMDSLQDRSHTPHRLQTTLTPAQVAIVVSLRMVERPGESDPNGNTISIERELMFAAETRQQFDRAVAIYKSSLNPVIHDLRCRGRAQSRQHHLQCASQVLSSDSQRRRNSDSLACHAAAED